MDKIFLIHSIVEGQVGCFQSLVIMNKGAMNIVEQVSLYYGVAFFEYMPRYSRTESLSRIICEKYPD